MPVLCQQPGKMKKTPVRPGDKVPALWTAFAEKEDFQLEWSYFIVLLEPVAFCLSLL